MSATVQDILSRHWMMHNTYDNLADKFAIHLNDTHPVLAIPELMRLLIDEHKFKWLDAWQVVTSVFSYTNHTLMQEALETWPVDMLGKILLRHLQLIFEINEHFLEEVQKKFPKDNDLLARVSIIDETNGRRVRMAWLALANPSLSKVLDDAIGKNWRTNLIQLEDIKPQAGLCRRCVRRSWRTSNVWRSTWPSIWMW